MHNIEPFHNWAGIYNAATDNRSPFYGRVYSETMCRNVIYDHYIHPQWDEFGSQTLYLKILFADYENRFAVIELMGEWNDILYNDVMFLYRDVIETLLNEGIIHFILIGENVLDFHSDTDDYFAEWFDNIEEGWIIGINFRQHVIDEFSRANIDQYVAFYGHFDELHWRNLQPDQLFMLLNGLITKQLGT
jgi:hypothetical protein